MLFFFQISGRNGKTVTLWQPVILWNHFRFGPGFQHSEFHSFFSSPPCCFYNRFCPEFPFSLPREPSSCPVPFSNSRVSYEGLSLQEIPKSHAPLLHSFLFPLQKSGDPFEQPSCLGPCLSDSPPFPSGCFLIDSPAQKGSLSESHL